MSDLKMLIWLAQLGLSVAVPIGVCIGIAVWLSGTYHCGVWVILVGLACGGICAVYSFRSTLAAMDAMAEQIHKRKAHPSDREGVE